MRIHLFNLNAGEQINTSANSVERQDRNARYAVKARDEAGFLCSSEQTTIEEIWRILEGKSVELAPALEFSDVGSKTVASVLVARAATGK